MRNFSDIQYNRFIEGPAGVSMKTGVLYINPTIWENLSPAARNFIIAHELGHLNMGENEFEADRYALLRRIDMGDDNVESIAAFYKSMPFDTAEQKERAEELLITAFENEVKAGNEKVLPFYEYIQSADAELFLKKIKENLSGKSAGAIIGGIVGGTVGTIIPGAGTLVGAQIGASIGGIAGNVYDNKKTSELADEQAKKTEDQAKKELQEAEIANRLNLASQKTEVENAIEIQQQEKKAKQRLISSITVVVIIGIIIYIIFKK